MNEREIAYKSLIRIIQEKQYSNIALRNNSENTPFITQLVYGTLRNYRKVRAAWSRYADKQPKTRIAILLDMAVYELFMMNSQPYAVLNEIVGIAKKYGESNASFVNALLRKVQKEDLESDDLAIATSHPDWLVKMWQAHYGPEVSRQILLEDIEEPRVALRVNTLRTSSDQLLQDPAFTKGAVEDCLYYEGNILESDYFKKGLVIIQSESSQEVINHIDLKENDRVLDLCAAPGTKSVQLASRLQGSGIVVANDLYDFRVNLIRQNARRYQLENLKPVCYDGTVIDKYLKPEAFDVVLLDAPCSGLGTLKHKPEIKQHIQPQDLDDIVSLQQQLLETASRMVKAGGTLMYSTCTLNKKENERQIATFISDHPTYQVELMKTIFPFDYHSDGFFYCRMKRT